MNEAGVVPRGALIKSATGLVSANKMFEGILLNNNMSS
jgi:hypothetical protein